jgi:hypothetical protein
LRADPGRASGNSVPARIHHPAHQNAKEKAMNLGTILLIIFILLLIGALPTWPYSSGWGYYPVGGIGLVVVILIILLLLGKL